METFVFGFDVDGLDRKGTNSCKGALAIREDGFWEFTSEEPQYWFDDFKWEPNPQVADAVKRAVEKDCPFMFAASVYGGARYTFLCSDEFADEVGIDFRALGNCKTRKRRFPGENDVSGITKEKQS